MFEKEENDFVRKWYEEITKENNERGILFPFLVTKNLKENRIIRAKQIKSSKKNGVCFACLSYQEPGKAKPKSPYNGVFFSADMVELEEEGLVEIQNFHTKAIINMYKEDLPSGGYRLYLQVVPDPASLEMLFATYEAIYVNNKAILLDIDIPF